MGTPAIKLDNKKLTKILSISIGSLLALTLIFIGFKLFSGVFTKASDTAPRTVIITANAQNTAKITWDTDQETQGVIEYGSSPTALNFFAPEAQKGKKHTADLTLLSPGTTYYFQVRIGDQKYDNGGVPWTFTTKSKAAAGDATGEATLTPTPTTGLVVATIIPTPTSPIGVPIIRPTSVLVYKVIPTAIPLPTLAFYVCGETNCTNICQKLGKTCSTHEWFYSGCVGKVNPITCATIYPTNTPAPTATGAPTSTPTPTPTSTPTPTLTLTPTPTYTPTPTPTTHP